jgi:predicted MFS family arabinose efflux permease
MDALTHSVPAPPVASRDTGLAGHSVIALLAFLTVVDLFAAQALLPLLAIEFAVSPGTMGLAVNATTIGMALAGLAVALFGKGLAPARGVPLALLVLAVPTVMLAFAPNLWIFALLRVLQGLCMATAFTLTLTHLGARGSQAGFAAYVTGNVASNLFGRLVAAGVASHFGLSAAFYAFATMNIAGALLAARVIGSGADPRPAPVSSAGASAGTLLAAPVLAGFGVGFCILFAFIGTFTYVNVVLVRPPLSLGMMDVGLVYLVFAPSILTTPFAGRAASRIGVRGVAWLGLGTALAGLPLTLLPSLPFVLAGLSLVGVGTFLAQAVATGFVSRAAGSRRAAASGIYLASYFSGGLVGSAVLGRVFDQVGWTGCVAGVGAALATALALATFFKPVQPS